MIWNSVFWIGIIVYVVGCIWLCVVAFKEHVLWGLGCLFLPIVQLVFLVMHWRKALKPFFVLLLGLALFVFASQVMLKGIRAQAREVVCRSGMRMLGMSFSMYLDDNNIMFPTSSKWCDLLGVHESSLRCPGASYGPCNYAMNKNVEKLGLRSPRDMVLLFETHPGWNQSGGPEILTTDNHRGKGCNVLFVNLKAEFVKTEDLDDLKWDIANNEAEKP